MIYSYLFLSFQISNNFPHILSDVLITENRSIWKELPQIPSPTTPAPLALCPCGLPSFSLIRINTSHAYPRQVSTFAQHSIPPQLLSGLTLEKKSCCFLALQLILSSLLNYSIRFFPVSIMHLVTETNKHTIVLSFLPPSSYYPIFLLFLYSKRVAHTCWLQLCIFHFKCTPISFFNHHHFK